MISDRLVLIDCRYREWRKGPEYQQEEPGRHGFLQMKSSDGETLHFSEVVNRYGFSGDDGPYLEVKVGTYP